MFFHSNYNDGNTINSSGNHNRINLIVITNRYYFQKKAAFSRKRVDFFSSFDKISISILVVFI